MKSVSKLSKKTPAAKATAVALSGVELRCAAHYMAASDLGAPTRDAAGLIRNGDFARATAVLIGLLEEMAQGDDDVFGGALEEVRFWSADRNREHVKKVWASVKTGVRS